MKCGKLRNILQGNFNYHGGLCETENLLMVCSVTFWAGIFNVLGVKTEYMTILVTLENPSNNKANKQNLDKHNPLF